MSPLAMVTSKYTHIKNKHLEICLIAGHYIYTHPEVKHACQGLENSEIKIMRTKKPRISKQNLKMIYIIPCHQFSYLLFKIHKTRWKELLQVGHNIKSKLENQSHLQTKKKDVQGMTSSKLTKN